MVADAAREQRNECSNEQRLAERGTKSRIAATSIDRGDYEPDRGEEPIVERSLTAGIMSLIAEELGPGMAGAGAHQVATDIFRSAAGLGGHLVVAFVAPIGASATMSRPRVSTRASSSEAQAAAARAHWPS